MRNKINRKTADPEILQAYEELRYERRYPKLEIAAYFIRAIGYLGFLPVFFLPEGARLPYAEVWVPCLFAAIIMELSLMVFWQPPGRRFKFALIIVSFLAAVIILMAGFMFLVSRII